MNDVVKVYLAGSCAKERRTVMEPIAFTLRQNGFDVYCPFELKIENAWSYSQEEWAQKVFDADVKALDSADVVLVISEGRMSSAGTNWEQGYAFAKGKKVVVLQVNEAPTSLMSYCGCTSFLGMQYIDYCRIDSIVQNALSALTSEEQTKQCRSILT